MSAFKKSHSLLFALVLIAIATLSNGDPLPIGTTEQPADNSVSVITDASESLEGLKKISKHWSTFSKTLNVAKKNVAVGPELFAPWQHNTFAPFYEFQKRSFLTDCTFIVGPDGQEEKFEAHSWVLVVSSPLFKEAFAQYKTTSGKWVFRIDEISKSDFPHILSFIYLGNICTIETDAITALFKYADLMGLDGMRDAARTHILTSLNVDSVWKVYKVAKETGDIDLQKTTQYFISRATSDILKHPGFVDISKDIVLEIASQKKLNIDSEYQLYEAIVRWAMHQVQKQALTESAEVIRQIIGEDILKKIRFCTMSTAEFGLVYKNLLTYFEIVPILFNIDTPGSVAVPVSVSNILRIRNETAQGETFTAVSMYGLSVCNTGGVQTPVGSPYLTQTPKITVWNKVGLGMQLAQVKFQKSLEAMVNCDVTKEQLDVVVTNAEGGVVKRTSYDGIPGCDGDYFNVTLEGVTLGNNENYKIHVEFRANRQYNMNSVEKVQCQNEDNSIRYDYDVNSDTFECEIDSDGFISSLFYTTSQSVISQ